MAEETKATEQPAGEATPAPAKETPPAVDVDGLISELEKAGVASPQDLTNKLEASAQSGRLAQLLGDERKRSQNLETQVAEMQRMAVPKQTMYDDPFEQAEQPIDLESAMERSVNKVLDRRDKAALQAHQQNLAKWNQIQSDKDYGLVKDVWEGHLKDPNFALQIQNGMVDPYLAYNETVRGYYKGMAQQSLDVIKQLRGGSGIPPPHVETGERVPTNIVSTTGGEEPDSVKRTRELKGKVEKGHQLTSDEELEIIDSLLHAPTVPAVPMFGPKR